MRLLHLCGLPTLFCAAFLLQSCGSSNTGGTSVFETVNATVSVDPAQNPLLSDLATWTGTPCTPGSTFSIDNDLVNFETRTTINIKNGTPSPLILQKATITFTPADTVSPTLPALYSPAFQPLTGYTVPAGGSLSVPIEIANHSLKNYMGSSQGLGLVCSVGIYSYNATIIFDAVESNTGKSGSLTASMLVRFADFAD